MNRNLYNKELKRNRKNLFIWSGIAVSFTFMITSLYPTFQNAGQAMMDAMPKEMTKAFGMDMAEWKHIMGYYKTYYGFHIILIMSIYACSCGANILSKEEREKTSEFLFSKPISRKSIFISKTFSLLTLIILIFALQTSASLLGVFFFDNGTIDWNTFFYMHFNGFVLISFFGALGLLISLLSKPKKNFMGIVVGIVFTCYFLHAISKSLEDVEWIGLFSPFHYLNFDEKTNFISVAIFIAIIALSIISSFKLLEKKNINA